DSEEGSNKEDQEDRPVIPAHYFCAKPYSKSRTAATDCYAIAAAYSEKKP
ncbi:hypothetical protein K3495_g9944, partial [Podosphaera aphanis]